MERTIETYFLGKFNFLSARWSVRSKSSGVAFCMTGLTFFSPFLSSLVLLPKLKRNPCAVTSDFLTGSAQSVPFDLIGRGVGCFFFSKRKLVQTVWESC